MRTRRGLSGLVGLFLVALTLSSSAGAQGNPSIPSGWGGAVGAGVGTATVGEVLQAITGSSIVKTLTTNIGPRWIGPYAWGGTLLLTALTAFWLEVQAEGSSLGECARFAASKGQGPSLTMACTEVSAGTASSSTPGTLPGPVDTTADGAVGPPTTEYWSGPVVTPAGGTRVFRVMRYTPANGASEYSVMWDCGGQFTSIANESLSWQSSAQVSAAYGRFADSCLGGGAAKIPVSLPDWIKGVPDKGIPPHPDAATALARLGQQYVATKIGPWPYLDSDGRPIADSTIAVVPGIPEVEVGSASQPGPTAVQAFPSGAAFGTPGSSTSTNPPGTGTGTPNWPSDYATRQAQEKTNAALERAQRLLEQIQAGQSSSTSGLPGLAQGQRDANRTLSDPTNGLPGLAKGQRDANEALTDPTNGLPGIAKGQRDLGTALGDPTTGLPGIAKGQRDLGEALNNPTTGLPGLAAGQSATNQALADPTNGLPGIAKGQRDLGTALGDPTTGLPGIAKGIADGNTARSQEADRAREDAQAAKKAIQDLGKKVEGDEATGSPAIPGVGVPALPNLESGQLPDVAAPFRDLGAGLTAKLDVLFSTASTRFPFGFGSWLPTPAAVQVEGGCSAVVPVQFGAIGNLSVDMCASPVMSVARSILRPLVLGVFLLSLALALAAKVAQA